jgi:hypothetical protein
MGLLEIEDRLFSANRLARLCLIGGAIFVVGNILDLAWRLGTGLWVFDSHGHFRLLDFVWLWTGGNFALRGSAIQAFDYSPFAAAQRDLVPTIGADEEYFHWIYPPVLLLYAMPFALLPYAAAFVAWSAATGALYLSAIHRILRRHWTALLALAPTVVAENLALGHTGFLTAGLLGFSLAVMESTPFFGGVILGLLAYKPQTCLLFPIVLVAAGCWRIVAGAALGVLLLAVATVGAFGPQIWIAFLHSLLAHDPRTLMPDATLEATLQTVFGIISHAGLDLRLAWGAQIGVAGLVAAFCCYIWRRALPYELKAAALSAGTLLATPYLLAYDLAAIVVPAAFLIRLGLASGFLPGERGVLLLCFFVSLGFVFPVGPFILAALLALVLRRAVAGSSPSDRLQLPPRQESHA